MKTDDQIRTDVREHYSAIARGEARTGCCAPAAPLGYSPEDLAAPGNLGLGCGNPHAIASPRPGEVVLDLGSGAGFDCFLAARAVGEAGKVIGVDGSADMIALARSNAAKHDAVNVEFRLGEIERLPVADASVDVVISNCVVNLAPDKRAVFAEVLRVLQVGGRLAISDVVALKELPAETPVCGCIGGAATIDELTTILREAGFADVEVAIEPQSREIIASWGGGYEDAVASARITATKPGGARKAAACCAPGCCA